MKCAHKLVWTVVSFALLNCLGMASTVVVTPSSAQIKPGAQQQFVATGSGSGVVLWGVSGSGCSGISCGVITSEGLYTAPLTPPNPANVAVMATSLFDLTQSGVASVTIGVPASVAIAIFPTSATIGQSGQQQFSAAVTGTSSAAVNWTVSGVGCVSGSCGSITSGGLYTAPAVLPASALATVTATSVAVPTKSASATVVIEAATAVSVLVSPASTQLAVGGQKQFTATVTGTTNTFVRWSLAGTGCTGSVCGSISASGLYTAPPAVPLVPRITVTATAVAAPSRSSSALLTIVAGSSNLTISPSSPQVKPGAQIQFSASGPGSGIVIWSVSGSGCSGISCGSITATGFYTAPAVAPVPATVAVTATSLSNASISGSTTVLISGSFVAVSVSPASVQLSIGSQQQFKAVVTGNTNTAVLWSLSGYGCSGTECGAITSGGIYTAPPILPNPAIVFVKATSVADSTKTSIATVTLVTPIVVSISPTSAQVSIGGALQFTAKVTGTSITGVNWSVAGSGCSGAACGTVSSSGLYTAPATAPSPATVTLHAVSVADGHSAASATITIFIPIIVTITPASAIVTVNDQLQFRARVSGTTNASTIWSVSGAGCAGSSCGTISSSGLYTAPAVVPAQSTVIVKVSSQANLSAAASAVVSLFPSNNAKFVGQYAFRFSGFNSQGVYEEAGFVKADGNGKILSGLEDVNDTASPATELSISGTYQVGPDNRGVMTINSPLGVHVFRFALNLLGTKGRLISFDTSGIRGSGVIERQDPTAFNTEVLTGGYVLNLAGVNVFGGRVGALGLIFPDGNGFISGSSLDVNEGGVLSPTFATFSGTYGIDPNGHGTITLSVPGFDGGSFTFSFYVVSANELLLVSIDPFNYNNPVFSGSAEAQTGTPFTSASFHGGSVFELSGLNGIAPEDTAGHFQFNSGGAVQVNFDQNSGGQLTVGGVMSGAYDIQLNGRGTLNLDNPVNGSQMVWILYAISPNSAFLMDGSTGSVAVGEMRAQTAVFPFSNVNLFGPYVFGSHDPVLETEPLDSGTFSFDGGTGITGLGSVSGTEDISQVTVLSPSQLISGGYSVSGVSNNGRGTIILSLPVSRTIAVWIVNASEAFGVDVDPSTKQPTILHFEQ